MKTGSGVREGTERTPSGSCQSRARAHSRHGKPTPGCVVSTRRGHCAHITRGGPSPEVQGEGPAFSGYRSRNDHQEAPGPHRCQAPQQLAAQASWDRTQTRTTGWVPAPGLQDGPPAPGPRGGLPAHPGPAQPRPQHTPGPQHQDLRVGSQHTQAPAHPGPSTNTSRWAPSTPGPQPQDLRAGLQHGHRPQG